MLDKMPKIVKEKTRKARRIQRKYEITSIDKNPIIKETWSKKKSNYKPSLCVDMKNEQNSSDISKYSMDKEERRQ